MALLVKICGLRTTEAAQTAIDSGADLLGVIMVPNRKRTVSKSVAKQIAQAARVKRDEQNREFRSAREIAQCLQSQNFPTFNEYFATAKKLILENGPFLVGVFRNQNIETVFELAQECGLDFIQLHGSEDVVEYVERNSEHQFGVIKRYVIPDHIGDMKSFFPQMLQPENSSFMLPLLDSEAGGEGLTIDWSLINQLDGKFMLAGGLNPGNLHETTPFLTNVVGFDVSGGVENAAGDKDESLIKQFIANGKQIA